MFCHFCSNISFLITNCASAKKKKRNKKQFVPASVLLLWFVINRQSYSPTVLWRVGLDHECKAHAGTFSPRGQRNMRKLRQSLPNLRKIFNIVKFPRAYVFERSLSETTKGRCAHYYYRYPFSSPVRFQLLNLAVFCWFLSFCGDSAATN